MRLWVLIAAMVAVLLGATQAFAQCHEGQAKAKAVAGDGKSCAGEKSAAGCCKDKGDANACCKSGMPRMAYKVGDKTTACPDEAKKLADGNKAKIHYVVAEKEYNDEGEALKAYAEVLDKHFDTITSVQYVVGEEVGSCPVGAKALAEKTGKPVQFRVASFTFDNAAAAEKASKLGREAAEKVSMKMVVDGKEYTCPMSAKEACGKSGKQVEYVVGETHTPCEQTAKVELAKARIEAAVKAMETVAKA